MAMEIELRRVKNTRASSFPPLSPQGKIPLSEQVPLFGLFLLTLTWGLSSLLKRRLDQENRFQSVIAFPEEEMLAIYFLYAERTVLWTII